MWFAVVNRAVRASGFPGFGSEIWGLHGFGVLGFAGFMVLRWGLNWTICMKPRARNSRAEPEALQLTLRG